MYNPIVGIYELKRFMGLSDLPKSDDRIARVLRYKSSEKWLVVNADIRPLKFWENFWCTYSDCVFVDLNSHTHDHAVTLPLPTGMSGYNQVRIDLIYDLKVSDPVKIVESQITNTDTFMKKALESLVKKSVWGGDHLNADSLEARIRKAIATADRINTFFVVTNLSVDITYYKHSYKDNDSSDMRFNSDMRKLLEIANNSGLEDSEKKSIEKIFLEGPSEAQ